MATFISNIYQKEMILIAYQLATLLKKYQISENDNHVENCKMGETD